MYLKRLYDPADVAKLRDPNDPTETITPIGIEVLRAGPRQKFSPQLLAAGQAQGWLTMKDGVLTIHGAGGDLVYDLERSPGGYCCHCGIALEDVSARVEQPDGSVRTRGLLHVLAEHAGVESPDPNNPAGYEVLNAYDCRKRGN